MLQWKLFDVIVSGSAHTGLQLFFYSNAWVLKKSATAGWLSGWF